MLHIKNILWAEWCFSNILLPTKFGENSGMIGRIAFGSYYDVKTFMSAVGIPVIKIEPSYVLSCQSL